jgi:hypothetical protein
MALEVGQYNVENLVESHDKELFTEDLKELDSFAEEWEEEATILFTRWTNISNTIQIKF